MKPRLVEAAGVAEDLADHYETIHRHQPAAADRLLLAYHDLTERLRDWPLSGRVFESTDDDLPRIRVGKLPAPFHAYRVYYVASPEAVHILAVIHAAAGEERRLKRLASRTRRD